MLSKIKSYSLTAITESDIKDFLKAIEEYGKVKSGIVSCKYCGEKITFDNIHSFFPENNEVCYCCKKERCITEMGWK